MTWYIDTIVGVCIYAFIGSMFMVFHAWYELITEAKEQREKSNKEMKAQDEHNRIGFLLKLRDERKELKNNGI